MLALKKKKEADAAAASAAATAAASASSASSAAAPTGAASAAAAAASASSADAAGASGAVEKISIVGVAGGGSSRAAGGTRKLTPGEMRVRKDIEELDAGKVAVVEWPDPKNLMELMVKVVPDSGLWASAPYQFRVSVPSMYPHDPPKVHCDTPIYHPNIDWEGNVCLNILRKDWKPVLDLNTVIYGLITLFHEPNANDPLNHEAADELRTDRAKFEANVRRSLAGTAVMGHSFPRLVR